jgi:hypothetical protein
VSRGARTQVVAGKVRADWPGAGPLLSLVAESAESAVRVAGAGERLLGEGRLPEAAGRLRSLGWRTVETAAWVVGGLAGCLADAAAQPEWRASAARVACAAVGAAHAGAARGGCVALMKLAERCPSGMAAAGAFEPALELLCAGGPFAPPAVTLRAGQEAAVVILARGLGPMARHAAPAERDRCPAPAAAALPALRGPAGAGEHLWAQRPTPGEPHHATQPRQLTRPCPQHARGLPRTRWGCHRAPGAARRRDVGGRGSAAAPGGLVPPRLRRARAAQAADHRVRAAAAACPLRCSLRCARPGRAPPPPLTRGACARSGSGRLLPHLIEDLSERSRALCATRAARAWPSPPAAPPRAEARRLALRRGGAVVRSVHRELGEASGELAACAVSAQCIWAGRMGAARHGAAHLIRTGLSEQIVKSLIVK